VNPGAQDGKGLIERRAILSHSILMAAETEAKDFAWLCSILTSSSTAVPLFETIFLHQDEVTLWIAPSASPGSTQRRNFQEESVLTLADALNTFKSRRDRDNPQSAQICTAVIKGMRVAVDNDKLVELSSPRGSLGRCTALQPAFDRVETAAFYVVKLEETDGFFVSHFWQRRKGLLHPATNDRLYYKLLVYSKIIISAVFTLKRRKVASLELEFLANDRGEIWVLGALECALHGTASPKTPMSVKTMEVMQKTKKDLKPLTAFRISTPEQLLKDSDSESKDTIPPVPQPASPTETGETKISPTPTPRGGKAGLLPQLITISSMSVRGSPPRSSLFSNPHFKEIITRSYAKSQRKFADDLDQLFLDMEANYLAEDEPLTSPVFSTRMRHSSSNLFPRANEPSPALFEIPAPSKPAELQVPSFPSTSKHATPAASSRRICRKRPAVQSQGANSLQKIMEKYRTERRIEQLRVKHYGRSSSIPARVYYFKQVKLQS